MLRNAGLRNHVLVTLTQCNRAYRACYSFFFVNSSTNSFVLARLILQSDPGTSLPVCGVSGNPAQDAGRAVLLLGMGEFSHNKFSKEFGILVSLAIIPRGS